MVTQTKLVFRRHVPAGRDGPVDVREGGGRVLGEGLRHHPGRLRALCQGGQQGLTLHHQQDPAGRSDQI